MSSALAISAVTAVLQSFLSSVYNAPSSPLGSVSVSAIAPDIVQSSLGSGAEAQLQVNLFLHQVTPNTAWRNVGRPSVAGDGSTRLKNPPLALNLHYLLTAYASKDTQAEALLGFAVLMMHENPVLPRSQISSALNDLASSNPPSNPLAKVLSSSGLADQIEMLKITPSTLGREEMAWIWTALKADYRPTFAFDVSVALLESPLASSSPLPVLSQNITAQPGSTAPSFQIQLPGGESAALPGDTVTLAGQFSTGTVQVLLVHQRLGAQPPITPSAATSGSVSFAIPGNTPAGNYTLSVTVTNGSGVVLQSTLGQPIALAPTIPSPSAATAAANASGTLVTLTANPQVVTGQTVSLAMGGTTAPAQPFTAPTATLSFQFPALAHGSYLARLRVDGVDSPVTVNWSATPPSFTAPFINV
ncbi:MAG: Pvc16 family protein [Terriglobia bacterium]|jgi:hypothetical protein